MCEFQIPRLMGFKVGIFRISPIALWRIEDTTEMVFRRKKRRFSGRKQSKQQGK